MVPAIVIAVVVVIPMMVVFETSVRTIPVASVEVAAFMARTDPVRASVRRTSPVAFVPNVAAVHGIPVAIHPRIFWPRTDGHNVMAWRWRRPDLNSDRDLGSRMMSAKQEH